MNPLLRDWTTLALIWSAAIAVSGAIAVWWLRQRPAGWANILRGREHLPLQASPTSASLPTVVRQDRLRFQAMMDQGQQPMWLRAPDLSIVYANHAFARAMGVADRATAVVRGLELGHGALGQDGRALAHRVRRTQTEQTESASVIIGGIRRLYQFSEVPLADGWIVGRAEDMSAVDALQVDLISHMEAHQVVLEQLRAGIAVFDGDRRLRFVNRAYAALWGLDYDWLSANPLLTEILETLRQRRRLPEVTDFAEFRRRMERRFQTLLAPEEDLVHLPDGRCFREIAAPHPLGGLLLVLEDVTDRLALESSYNTLIAVQRGVLNQLADGVAAFGTDGRVTVFNPAFLRLLAIADRQLEIGVHVSDLLARLAHSFDDGPEWTGFRTSAAFAVTGREPMRQRLFLNDGRVLDVAFGPLSDASVLMSVRDITDTNNVERMLLERNAALEEANRLKTDFLANASYELRTPLTTISGFAELLESRLSGPLNPTQADYLAGISEASQTLATLIDSILDVSLGEAGQWDTVATNIALAPVINSVAAVVRPQMEAQGLTLEMSIAADVPTIQADERRLRQLVFNMMSCAVRHNRPGSRVDLNCTVNAGQVELAVGLQADGRLFDHRAIENELGLTLVQRLTALHGGRMLVQQQSDTSIALVCTLPRHRPPS